MEHGACNIVYLDRRAREELVRKDSVMSGQMMLEDRVEESRDEYSRWTKQHQQNVAEISATLASILSTFNEVYVCCSGTSCLAKLAELYDNPNVQTPTIVLIDIPYDQEQALKRRSREPRTPSPSFTRSTAPTADYFQQEDIYGIHFLTHISSEIQAKKLSKLLIPVVVLSGFERELMSPGGTMNSAAGSFVLADSLRLTRYLDAGAVDVLTSPISKDNVQGLAVHAYRVFKEVTREETAFLAGRHNRKLSWVGVEETKPYAYLREAMVSSLMNGICNPEMQGEVYDPRDAEIEEERRAVVAAAVGSWSFSAHDFTDDELLNGALIMLEHALAVPELEKWRMPTDDLTRFLQASRAAYNEFVLYHNFRHVVDVLQAVFYFLVQLGSLPPYPHGTPAPTTPRSAIATLVKPFDALTLLISSIGHDVGHPGVNNAFLVALNAPLAQLYNDRSVLESFHCAAYSQILRRHWRSAFEDIKMRKLMINSILATDMGLHFKYMSDMGNLQAKLHHNNNTLDGWNVKQLEEYRDLACGLLIKCADISNVARKFNVAAQWASILNDEFSNQGSMEKELSIPTQLFGGPPERDNVIKMAESQIGFMNIFARPLFEGVTDVLPAMQFSVDELMTNKATWQKRIEQEKECSDHDTAGRGLCVCQRARVDGTASPMTQSRTDLPATAGDVSATPPTPLFPVSPKTITGENQQRQSRRDSTNGSMTAILVTEAGDDPNEQDMRSTNGSNHKKTGFNPFCQTRLRQVSPPKNRDSPERPEKVDSPRRPQSSPTNSNNRQGLVDSSLPPPLPLMNFPSPPASKGDGYMRSHSNGNLDEPSTANIESQSKSYMTSVMNNSATDLSSPAAGKRTSRLGFPRLWRRKWRTASGTLRPQQTNDLAEQPGP